MNKYVLYCQNTSSNYGNFRAVCKDVFEISGTEKTINKIYDALSFEKRYLSRFAIVDPNGAVISSDLRLLKIERKPKSLVVNLYSAAGSVV